MLSFLKKIKNEFHCKKRIQNTIIKNFKNLSNIIIANLYFLITFFAKH